MSTGSEIGYGSSEHYDGKRGESYFEWQNEHGRRGAVLERRKFQAHVGDDDDVLDFGCAGGHLLDALSCASRAGVEANPAARAYAAEVYGIDARPAVADFEDGSFDVVVSNHVLEHVPYPIAALTEVRRVLRPSGRLLLCVPLDDWRAQRSFHDDDHDHHLHTWTPQHLGNTLLESGFHVEPDDIQILRHAWPPMYDRLESVSPGLLDAAAMIWSVLRRRRQLMAVVSKLP